jgi:carboxymethylenebutenolidase
VLIDRIERDVELGYDTQDQWSLGMKLAFEQYDLDTGLLDLQAAVDRAGGFGKVGLVGYCFGGRLACISACELDGLSAVSSFDGGGIAGEARRTARRPVQCHFGELDEGVTLAEVREFAAAQPTVDIPVYPGAGHGFNCDQRDGYHEASAEAALANTLDWFGKYLDR